MERKMSEMNISDPEIGKGNNDHEKEAAVVVGQDDTADKDLPKEDGEEKVEMENDAVNANVGVDEGDANIFSGLLHHHRQEQQQHQQQNHGLQSSRGPIPAKPELETEEERLFRLVRVDEEDTYSAAGKKRGVCLIFENDMFHTDLGLSRRKGSNVDRALMIEVFSKLQFEVRVFQNLATSEILNTLDKARFEDHTNNDMLAVIILSHGNEGILYGYDRPYPVHKIWEPFTANNCEELAGKPKLFFLQACQGNQMDPGVEVHEKKKDSRTETDSFASYRTPLHADFLIAHSTVTGYYSWRNTVQGSWFIQVLGAALLVNMHKQDLLTILTKVARVIGREYESNSNNKAFNMKKQIPFIYSTLTNKLVFSPK